MWYAAMQGNSSVVSYLLKKGAKLDVRDTKGISPLHKAIANGHEETVKVLVESGINCEQQDELGI